MLIDDRASWLQRIRATLFHYGIAPAPEQLLRAEGRAFLRPGAASGGGAADRRGAASAAPSTFYATCSGTAPKASSR
jgi:hypothetical protein